tara:strand:- start:2235 stop:3188 length:954 start_codon:yes stop_codon:yes gene_type:complete
MLYEGTLDSYKRETGHKLTKIEIHKDGRIKLVADQQQGRHDFEIVFNIFDLKSSIDYPDGIRAYKFIVHFQGLNVSSGYGITFATDADAKRVARAFRHLKTMSSKGGGLFDGPTQAEKKPTLTKSETLKYIENIVNNQPKLTNRTYDGNFTFSVEAVQTFYSGNFQTEIGKLWNDGGNFNYGEQTKKYLNLDKLKIDEVSIYPPRPEYLSGCSTNSECSLKGRYTLLSIGYIENNQYGLSYKSQTRDNFAYNVKSTSSEAKNDCKSREWQTFKGSDTVNIYLENQDDADRLKKAFEHLAALINEEKRVKEDSDPFGN